MKMEQSVPKRQHIKFRQPGNYPEENIKHTAHGESLKSRIHWVTFLVTKKILEGSSCKYYGI